MFSGLLVGDSSPSVTGVDADVGVKGEVIAVFVLVTAEETAEETEENWFLTALPVLEMDAPIEEPKPGLLDSDCAEGFPKFERDLKGDVVLQPGRPMFEHPMPTTSKRASQSLRSWGELALWHLVLLAFRISNMVLSSRTIGTIELSSHSAFL